MLKKFLQNLLSLFLILMTFLSIGLICLLAHITKNLPDINQIDKQISATTTKIYDKSGEILLYEYGNVQRIPVTLDQIPIHLQQATLAIEDYEFYQHQGFSIRGIGRSIWEAFEHKQFYGSGSTITQQLIKNSLLSSERTFMRKAQEIILAFQLEQHLSKKEILEKYFNAIPYGGMAYGCAEASQFYFNKNLKDLTLAEAAFLAGLTAAPTYLSPFGNNTETTTPDILQTIEHLGLINNENGKQTIPAWKKRQAKVLFDMATYGYISKEDAIKALKEPLIFQKPKVYKKAPHFVDYVQQQLVAFFAQRFNNDFQTAEQYIRENGFTVISSLEWDKQQLAERILAKHRAKLNARHVTNAALVAIKPNTGEIVAMVGSFDYYDENIDGQVNVITSANRQVGSSIKPLLYAYALEQGHTAVTLLNDDPKIYPNNYVPRNFNHQYHGKLYMRTALANSLNLPALDMIDQLGVSNTVDWFHEIGITTIEDKSKVGLALALGATEIKMLDLTYAFSVLANKGIQSGTTAIIPLNNKISPYRSLDPTTIVKIIDNQRNVIEEYQPNYKRIIKEGNAFIISDILSDYSARSLAFGSFTPLNIQGYRVAGKTGTTSGLKDITTLGYYPKIAVGVWCGNNDNSPMRGVSGVGYVAPIWNDFISAVIKSDGYEWYKQPAEVVTKWIYGRKEYFLANNIPTKILPEVLNTPTPTVTATPNPEASASIIADFSITATITALPNTPTPEKQKTQHYIITPNV